jgi:hypothetical protein
MWRKKTISSEEVAQVLWQNCCESVEDFCTKLKPKLVANGFLTTPAENSHFNLEAMQLHHWMNWLTFGENAPVLILLAKMFANWDITQQQARASKRMQQRCDLYYQAYLQDEKLPHPTKLGEAALQCLLNTGKPVKSWLLTTEVQFRIHGHIQALLQTKAQFNILGT